MKFIVIIALALSASLFAQSKPEPKLSDSTLKDYWHAIAAHHAQNAAFQGSLTSQQKQIQESIQKIDAEIESIRKKLAAECGDKATLDESGAEPACKPKPEDKPTK